MVESETKSLGSWVKLERAKLDLIQRDMEGLGLDENSTVLITSAEEIEGNLGQEFPDYNADITESNSNKNNIVVISGYSPSKEKDVKLYYYENGEDLIRQLREYNYKGQLKGIKRAAIYEDGRHSEVDEGSVSYAYDENGFKKYAKIENPFVGYIFFIYDDDGRVEFKITDEYIDQFIKDGDKEYHIIDGHIAPECSTNEGYIFTYLPSKSLEELKPEDIKRAVYGNISEEEKEAITADLNQERQEQILNAMSLTFELEWITQEPEELDYLDEKLEDEEIEHPTPEEAIEESITESIDALRKSGKSYTFEQFIKDSELEKHIQRAYGGAEFLEALLSYANSKSDLIKRNEQAKGLLNQYEQQSKEDGQTQSDEN